MMSKSKLDESCLNVQAWKCQRCLRCCGHLGTHIGILCIHHINNICIYIVYICSKCSVRLLLSINRSSCCSSRGSNIWKTSIEFIKAIIGYPRCCQSEWHLISLKAFARIILETRGTAISKSWHRDHFCSSITPGIVTTSSQKYVKGYIYIASNLS